MWWLIWIGLIVATIVGAIFLFRDLWRKAVTLGEELTVLGAAVERMQQRAEELQALFDTAPSVHPFTLTDEQRRDIRLGRVARKMAARARRAERHRTTYAHWASLMGQSTASAQVGLHPTERRSE